METLVLEVNLMSRSPGFLALMDVSTLERQTGLLKIYESHLTLQTDGHE
jgi:hypothetical protein